MKAITTPKYGGPDVLKLSDLPRPAPQSNEVLVRVRVSSVNAADWHVLRADPFLIRLMFGLFKPKFPVLGADVAGVVEAVGEGVTRFKAGDEVFGDLSESGWGGFAEYVAASKDTFARKPANLGFEQAAAAPMAGVTALQGLRDTGGLQAGQHVLISGASGGVGSFALQIAKALGARVSAVVSTGKVDLARELGADHVIDYTKEDFTCGEARYDLIFIANGERPVRDYRRVLAPAGTCVASGGTGPAFRQTLLQGPWARLTSGQRLVNHLHRPGSRDLQVLAGLLESGQVKPVIDRTYPLEEVPAAIAYLEEGHARGKVVIEVS